MTTALLSPSSRASGGPKSSLPPCVKEGWLQKVGGSVKTWKSRYFRLYQDEIVYYETDSSPLPKGSIPIRGSRLSVFASELDVDHPFRFAITPQASSRHYFIAASTHEERMQWIAALHPLCRIALRAQSGSLKEGYLTKQGGRVKTWKKRWVILTEKAMVYYKDVKDVKEITNGGQGGIDALDLTGGFDVDSERGGKDGEWVFTVKPGVGSGRVYKFACQTDSERESWVKLLREVKLRHDAQQMNIKF